MIDTKFDNLLKRWELELITLDQLLLAAAPGSRIHTELRARRKQLAKCVDELWDLLRPRPWYDRCLGGGRLSGSNTSRRGRGVGMAPWLFLLGY